VKYFETEYGYFNENGDYIITNVKTPMPWCNVLTNGRYGAIYTQTGSGYSFFIDASQSLLTRWIQDLIRDNYGKYYYVRNEDTGKIYTVTFQPVQAQGDYRVIYSPGIVEYHSTFEDFTTKLTAVVPEKDNLELNVLKIRNTSRKPLRLSIFSYFELNMGTNSDIHREFHRLFFETKYIKEKGLLLSKKHLWTAGPNHWNDSYPYVLFHWTDKNVETFETDKKRFLGMYGSLTSPAAVRAGKGSNTVGRHGDKINSLHVSLTIEPGKEEIISFIIGVAESEENAINITEKYKKLSADNIIEYEKERWNKFLSPFKVELPEKDIEFLLNKWLPYQAIAGRLLARTAYYQMGGAYGYRDQLQDSLAGLWLDPDITRKQILLHAAHQRCDGSVQHWWLPFNNASPAERWSDDLLWLPFAVAEYIEHTGDNSILEENVEFIDVGHASIKEHCFRSIKNVLNELSPRNIPLILDGDWNDGMNGLGKERKGESFWMSEFLYYVLNRATKYIAENESEKKMFREAADLIKKSFEKYAWNGKWFNRATKDSGEIVGGLNDNRIFLNTQNWAVISEIADKERSITAINHLKERLLTDYGPLLFNPPFTKADSTIGYLSRYSPGSRENGGVYTHAAVWTIWAGWKMKDAELVDKVYDTLSPVKRSTKNPELYSAEPYVLPGNSEGPFSEHAGRAGWTWYTGSAGWMYRSLIQYMLGIKPTEEGILFSPCTNRSYKQANITFSIRSATYHLTIHNPEEKSLSNFKYIELDGERLKGNLIPYIEGKHTLKVIY